jgi:DNA polymerase-3 subunit gamma/tau
MLGITGDARVKEIVRHVLHRDVSSGMATLNSVNNDGLDLKQFNRELIEYLRNLLLIKTGAVDSVDLTVEDINELKELAEKASLPQILTTLKLFGQIEMGNTENTTLPLELALIETYLALEHPTLTAIQKEVKPVPLKPPIEPKPETKPNLAAAPPVKAVQTSAVISEPRMAPLKTEEKKEEFLNKPAVIEEPVITTQANTEIERLRAGWKQILEEPSIRKTSSAALMRSSKPLTFENDVVVLSFQHPALRDNLQKPENLKIAEKIISDFFSRACKVHCICGEAEKNHLTKAAIKLGAQITSVEEK